MKGGLRATDEISGDAVTESCPYVVGPAVEVALPSRFGVEVDALYHRFGYRTPDTDIIGDRSFTRERDDWWEFPVLLTSRLPHGFFGSGGISARRVSGTINSNLIQVNPYTGEAKYLTFTNNGHYDTGLGLVAGGGFRFGRRVRLTLPEVRYTHWQSQPIVQYGSHGYSYTSTQDQLDVLTGFSFGN